MNVVMFLKYKDSVKYIYCDNTLRQGLEKMRAHSYTAIPVIDRNGKYVGTVSEGDFLWHIIDKRTSGGIERQENYRVSDIIRHDFNPAVKISVTMGTLLEKAMNQNFVPVTDDTGVFIGIVTRQDIIKFFVDRHNKQKAENAKQIGD